jgi:hypothetical protein
MVCAKCEKKLTRVACPEKWKEDVAGPSSLGGRALGENKLLSKKKDARWQPYAGRCTVCKGSLPASHKFCQKCAYNKGLCGMCGAIIIDTSAYKQSTA